jgi:transketolase
MAEESLRARYGRKVVDHRTYVIAGDGCLMEGVSHEAIALAGKQMLRNLIVFWDNNGITIDGHVDLADITDQVARFKAAGWHVQSVDGHNPEEIDNAIEVAKTTKKPSMIDCRTHIALGHAAQDTAKGHGALTDPEQLAEAKAAYGWEHGPFEIPEDVKAQWEAIGERGLQERDEWQVRFAELPVRRQDELKRMYDFRPPHRLIPAVRNVKRWASEEHPNIATRKSSELLLGAVNPVMPEMIGGSADLTGSNNTNAGEIGVFDPENRKGRYIHYGIREHGMAAVMNGMALHGGVRPYGGTFMCFTDYARPAMRLSALMKMPVVYVMTHDSIGLGEDGPTHQPVEHLAISRATPNTYVFRPADTVETAESWELALGFRDSPSVIALSRQSLPAVRLEYKARNQVAYGAYILAESTWKRQVILLASGSEVHVAMAAREKLESLSLATRVVSVPCMELFAQQDEGYRRKILPSGPVRVAVEAGVRQGWDRWLFGERGRHDRAGFIGMSSFGASAPADQLFSHFDITVQAIVDKVKELYA